MIPPDEKIIRKVLNWHSPNVYGKNFAALPTSPGVYVLIAHKCQKDNGFIAYIGSSANLHNRLKNHEVYKKISALFWNVRIFFKKTSNFKQVERCLIRKCLPEYNIHRYLSER